MKRIFCVLFFLLASEAIFAWGANGHRIVAQICYDNLSPNVQSRINLILGDDYLTQVATWPDFIRSDTLWDFTKPWHFVTINPDKTVQKVIKEGAKNKKIENVIEAIQLMTDILKGNAEARNQFQQLMDKNKVKSLNGSIDATALAFLVHFIGDIHQPMHVGKNKDLGGNKIIVEFFSKKMNLHSVWDEGIIQKELLSFSELAAFINKHQEKMKNDCENDPIEEWASESVNTRENIYNTIYDTINKKTGLPELSYPYMFVNLPIVEKRLAAAGYRAAAIINRIFK